MNLQKHIPNTLTCANLFIGCLALIEIFEGKLENVIYYVLASGFMDFLDGFAARLTKTNSDIGKDLDSLADMVSFSTVPAFLMYQMIAYESPESYLKYIPLCIAVLSGVRLAKFNNDTRQTNHFHGVPVPANALFICTLPILIQEGYFVSELSNGYILAIISVVMSLLLVSDLRLIALKFSGYGWSDNQPKYVLLIFSIVTFATFQLVAIPFIITFYILLSIFTNQFATNK